MAFTKWGFVVSQHGYHYQDANTYNCSITLETNETVEDEVSVARELDILLREGIIQHFGKMVHMIKSVQFHWQEKIIGNESRLTTQVTITYTTKIEPINAEEIQAILAPYTF